jgi:hypothetical protein
MDNDNIGKAADTDPNNAQKEGGMSQFGNRLEKWFCRSFRRSKKSLNHLEYKLNMTISRALLKQSGDFFQEKRPS